MDENKQLSSDLTETFRRIFNEIYSTSTLLDFSESSVPISKTPDEDEVQIEKLLQFEYLDSSDTSRPFSQPQENSTKIADMEIPIENPFISVFEAMVGSEVFESGVVNASEEYFLKFFTSNRLAAMNSLSKVFMDNYSLDGRKINVLVGVLHIISHLSYDGVYPLGQMMAIDALTHKNREVAEFGIKCFENWNSAKGIERLKAVQFSTKWLQEYADDIISELQSEDA